jgi:hypothetical protein
MTQKQPVYVVDIVGACVAAASLKVLALIQANESTAIGKASTIQAINYQYGHKSELVETLAQKDQSATGRFLKYPLVYLVQDFTERRQGEPGLYAETSLNIIIAHQTKLDDKVHDRYAKVFKPVLYPIYDALLTALYKSPFIRSMADTFDHSKTDRPLQAVGNKTYINDYVDAIEISNLVLQLNYQTCIN